MTAQAMRLKNRICCGDMYNILSFLLLILTRFALDSEAFLSTRKTSLSRTHQILGRSSVRIKAKWTRRYFEEEEDGSERERAPERPTLSEAELIGPPAVPSKPKIIVLGASGKIGSLVVRQLLEMNLDMTVVAFVRDYDKACRVLYDDVLVARAAKTKGPQLQIVVGDLVPPEELPGFVDEDEELWAQTAQSAAKFYGNNVQDYDNRDMYQPDVNEALQEAIKGCTSIISCVGAVRPTNLWSDYLAVPLWRLFRHDVSSWCKDRSHPYYVHYASTRKVLGFAEREQLKREACAAVYAEEDEMQPREIPRIRFVRVSDLCVTQKPWDFIPLVTNALHSMVFRYQDMTERLLEESKVVDTVILRPGDLIDDERDVNTTHVQVDATGKVPCPARVGRDDVAELAVSAVMFQAPNVTVFEDDGDATTKQSLPLKMSLGVRWVGEELDPYPPQGTKRDGLPDASKCMNKALNEYRANQNRAQRRKRKTKANIPVSIARYASSRRRSLKPYGVFVAVPVYFFLWVMLQNMIRYIPGYTEKVAPVLARIRDAVGAAIMAKVPSIQRWSRNILRRSNGKSYVSF